MLRVFLLSALVSCALAGQSQSFFDWQYQDRYFSVYAGTGWSGYFGDLTNGRPFTKGLSHFNIGVEARLYSRVAARVQYATYRIEGSDNNAADSSFNKQRNLSFYSQNHEWQAQLVYYFLKYRGKYHKRRTYEPYFALGVGQTFFNPKADLSILGETKSYTLRDFQTETETYGNSTWMIPVSLGVKLTLTEFLNLGVDVGYRYTFTGYLDDVYGNYADPNGDGQGYDDGSVEGALSNRKFEEGVNDINPEASSQLVPGAQRGNGRFDSYFLININLELYLPSDVFKSKKGRGRKQKLIGKPSAYD